MLTKRIIPCLDVNHGRVVKGRQFKNLRDVDDPVALGKAYSMQAPMNSSSTTSPPPTRTAPSSPRPSKPLPGKFPSPSPSEAA